jgi:hypothetical protein
MKKTTITLTFMGKAAEEIDRLASDVDVAVLLRDALSDFRRARIPIHAYVKERYPYLTPNQAENKVKEVARRLLLSEHLSKADVDMESKIVSGDVASDDDYDLPNLFEDTLFVGYPIE